MATSAARRRDQVAGGSLSRMASGCIPTVSPHLSQFEFGTLDCLHPCHKGSRTIMLAQCCYRYQSTPLQLVGTVAPYFFLMWIGKNSLILRSEHRIRPLNQVFCCEVSPNDCTPSPLFEQPFNMYILYIVPNDCTLDAHLSNTTPRGRHALHIVLHVVLHIVLHTQACHCMCGTVQSTVQFRKALYSSVQH